MSWKLDKTDHPLIYHLYTSITTQIMLMRESSFNYSNTKSQPIQSTFRWSDGDMIRNGIRDLEQSVLELSSACVKCQHAAISTARNDYRQGIKNTYHVPRLQIICDWPSIYEQSNLRSASLWCLYNPWKIPVLKHFLLIWIQPFVKTLLSDNQYLDHCIVPVIDWPCIVSPWYVLCWLFLQQKLHQTFSFTLVLLRSQQEI